MTASPAEQASNQVGIAMPCSGRLVGPVMKMLEGQPDPPSAPPLPLAEPPLLDEPPSPDEPALAKPPLDAPPLPDELLPNPSPPVEPPTSAPSPEVNASGSPMSSLSA